MSRGSTFSGVLRRFTLSFLVLVAATASIAEVPRARPEEVGLSSGKLARIDTLFAEKVQKGELAGIVVLVARHGRVAHLSAFGDADAQQGRKLKADSLFRIYSMTKPMTAAALMTLYEEGRFQLTQPLSDYIPEFKDLKVLRAADAKFDDVVAPKRAPTILDSLRHTAGFTHGIAGDAFDEQYVKAGYFGLDVTLAGMMARLAKLPLRYEPGTRWEYSVGPDIDARIVEVLSGQPFDEFLEQRIFKPLGMRDTAFSLGRDKAGRLATVYWMKDGKLTPLDAKHGSPDAIAAITRPDLVNSYTAEHPRKGGSYGLVSSAEDYWRFAQMILNGGELDGARILGPRTVSYMLSDHLTGSGISMDGGMSFGLGFGVVRDPAAFGRIGSKGTAFWGGAASTGFWIDPVEDLVVVTMTQHFSVPATGAIEEQIASIVYGAIEEKGR